MSDTLVILGASARAAAASAVRAGFRPACGDLFADVDLRRLGPALATPDFPSGLASLARQLPVGPWIYTGGLENYPDLVEAVSLDRVLYGNPPATLRAARDPARLARALNRHGLKLPECRPTADELPRDGSWLRKRFHSSGGQGVRAWRGGAHRWPGEAYFQRRIVGPSCAAVFVAANRQAQLVGVTKQLLGLGSSHAGAFHYRGSVGPLRLTIDEANAWQRIGAALADEFDLQGLFGVDAVVDARGDIWPVEVNPRYTASVEILERGLGVAALGWHVAACRDRQLPADSPTANGWHGKAIVYAPWDLRIGDEFVAALERSNEGRAWPAVADLPASGTTIRRGQPIVTVFAEADDQSAMEYGLNEREQELIEIVRTLKIARPG
jgi:uncharacterized protein